MEERQFFGYLLDKTGKVFLQSKTYSLYGDKNWNFAVCETPIQKGTGVFFGLNWGGDQNTWFRQRQYGVRENQGPGPLQTKGSS